MSQKLSLLLRFFFRSSVNRSAFIWALSRVTPGQFVSSMSFAASSSNWKAQNKTICGLGFRWAASSNASSTVRCSNGACSGPKQTNTLCTFSPPPEGSGVGFVSVSACKYRVPLNGSTLVNSISLPPFALTPARSSSSRQLLWRRVSPLRATDVSAVSPPPAPPSVRGTLVSPAGGRFVPRLRGWGEDLNSSNDFATGAGTASTVKGPVTRNRLLSINGWSYKVSCPGGSLLAMLLRVICGTVLYLKPLPTPSFGCASS